jgi:hypothetical protein
MKELDKLKTLIKAELNLCNRDKTPTVCDLASDPEQYGKIETMIIDRIKEEGISIGQAISEIERTYNINLIND